jgi:hypothetical protein
MIALRNIWFSDSRLVEVLLFLCSVFVRSTVLESRHSINAMLWAIVTECRLANWHQCFVVATCMNRIFHHS